MKEIKIFDYTGEFAENKDTARDLRIEQILPILKEGEKITLDFQNVNLSTQSFIHALISDLIRSEGIDVLDLMSFKNCNETITTLIKIVVAYMQDIPLDV